MKALTDMTIIDGTGKEPVENGVIVINNEGKIISCGTQENIGIPENAERIDCQGKTVVPGLIDSHVHLCLEPCADPGKVLMQETDVRTGLKAARYAEKTLFSGVTSVRDMGGKNYVDIDIRNAINAEEYPGPYISASGRALVMTGGHGWQNGEEVDGETEVRWGARKQLKHGADQIKLMATGGVMTEGVEPGASQLTEVEMRAGIEEAEKAGKKTAAHAEGTDGIKNAIRAGVDSIEHGHFLDDEAISMMKDNNVTLVPTLAASYWISEKGEKSGIPQYMIKKMNSVYRHHLASFEKAYKAGVEIAMGTDAGTPFNFHGNNSYELVLMVENGMSPVEAIKSATAIGARLLGIFEETGTIAPGKRADLLVLNDDPLENIENITKVHRVYKKGEVFFPDNN